MPQMSPIYWLMLMLYFIFILMISITTIYFFFQNLSSTKSFIIKTNSMNWTW